MEQRRNLLGVEFATGRVVTAIVDAIDIKPFRDFGRKRNPLFRTKRVTVGHWRAWLKDMEGSDIANWTDEVMSRLGEPFDDANGCWENYDRYSRVWDAVAQRLAERCFANK